MHMAPHGEAKKSFITKEILNITVNKIVKVEEERYRPVSTLRRDHLFFYELIAC